MIKNDEKTNYKNISEIEKIVDEIILENKERLEQTNLKIIYPDKFSYKNKNIFYFKKTRFFTFVSK